MEIPDGSLDVLAIGETVIDLISDEEADSLGAASTFNRYQGGSPANLAAYVAKLGGRSALISKVGLDPFGEFARDRLMEAGVETGALRLDEAVNTTVIFITRTPGTAESLALRNGDYQLTVDEVDEDVIRRARVVHASTFALSRQPARSAVAKALHLAHDHRRIVSLDPNYNPLIWPDREEARAVLGELFTLATLTKPSLDDATRLFGEGRTPEAYINLYHDLGPGVVVLTMGDDGTLLSSAEGQLHVPAREVEVADATGAGDAFWAGFLMALLDGSPLRRCALFAREIVERKLRTVGPFAAPIDRQVIYALLEA
ncbi:MAG: carbohydrate kinase family protein [Anaerolineales bacterium]